MHIVTVNHLIKGGRTLYIDAAPPRSRAAIIYTRVPAAAPKERKGITVTTPAIAARAGITGFLPLGGTVAVGPFTLEPVWESDRAVNVLIDGDWYYLAELPPTVPAFGRGTTLLAAADEPLSPERRAALDRFLRDGGFGQIILSGAAAGQWRSGPFPVPVTVKERPRQTPIEW